MHVRTHKSPVSIVMLKEGYERCGHGYDLSWRNIHIVNLLWLYYLYVILVSHIDPVAKDSTLLIGWGILSYNKVFLLISGEMLNLVSNLSILHLPVGSHYKTILVGLSVYG